MILSFFPFFFLSFFLSLFIYLFLFYFLLSFFPPSFAFFLPTFSSLSPCFNRFFVASVISILSLFLVFPPFLFLLFHTSRLFLPSLFQLVSISFFLSVFISSLVSLPLTSPMLSYLLSSPLCFYSVLGDFWWSESGSSKTICGGRSAHGNNKYVLCFTLSHIFLVKFLPSLGMLYLTLSYWSLSLSQVSNNFTI